MTEKDFEGSDGELKAMPCYPPFPYCPPRKIIEFEIDDHNAGYNFVSPTVKKICADYQNCELHIKVKLNG